MYIYIYIHMYIYIYIRQTTELFGFFPDILRPRAPSPPPPPPPLVMHMNGFTRFPLSLSTI